MDECTVMSHFTMKFFTDNSMAFVKSPKFFKVFGFFKLLLFTISVCVCFCS